MQIKQKLLRGKTIKLKVTFDTTHLDLAMWTLNVEVKHIFIDLIVINLD